MCPCRTAPSCKGSERGASFPLQTAKQRLFSCGGERGHIACRRGHRCMRKHIACERGHRSEVLSSTWQSMRRLCNQPQITKASQCRHPFFKFCMTSMRILNLDNKQTGGSPRAS